MDTEKITAAIIALEKEALARWNNGDPDGFLDLSSDDVIYFDPFVPEKFVGKKSLSDWYDKLRGQDSPDYYEMIDPRVQVVSDYCAILGYDYEGCADDQIYRMHCTEVYVREQGGVWKIINTHWSFVCEPEEE